MKTELLLVGKTTDKNLQAGIDDYVGRIGHYMPFALTVIPELKNTKSLSEEQQKSLEGEAILKLLQPSDTLVILDEKGREYRSVEEDRKEVAMYEREVFGRYAQNTVMARKQINALEKEREKETRSVRQGAEAYIPTISYHARLDRKLEIFFFFFHLNVLIDGKPAVSNLKVRNVKPGRLFLGAGWQGYGYSQVNLADDVYDAVFSEFKVEQLFNEEKNDLPVLYDVHYTGAKKMKLLLKRKWEAVLDWALQVF